MPQSCKVYLTTRDSGARLTQVTAPPWKPVNEDPQPAVVVYDRTKYQTIHGFGGAFTEAAASVLYKLPPNVQEEVLNSYFHPQQGHAYTLARSHINSCDFSLNNYALQEKPDGEFSLERDRQALIPMIQRAAKIASKPISLLSSPWSPPAWMKTNGEMNHGGNLKAEYRDTWAKYYCKFVNEYAKQGIPIWALTVQNEPKAVQRWDSCIYSALEERDFVRDHLGPTLKKEKLDSIKLLVWDHNRDMMFERVRPILDDPAAAAYVWGTAFHWYTPDCFDNVQSVHDAWPDKHLLFTEGCQENGPNIGVWTLGERYARSIIQDLNHWAEGWIDWNLLLDITGGPNHVKNLCSAPIIADLDNGKVIYQSSYYYLGHFSRFIKPGAQRVLTAKGHDDLEVTAAKNSDGSIVVVVLNRTETPIKFTLKHLESGTELASPARSIQTIVF